MWLCLLLITISKELSKSIFLLITTLLPIVSERESKYFSKEGVSFVTPITSPVTSLGKSLNGNEFDFGNSP